MSEQPATTPQPGKKGGFLKAGAIGCGGLLVLIIVLGVIFGPTKEERTADQRREDSLEALMPEEIPEAESAPPVVEEKKRGTGTTRRKVISFFEQEKIEFRFEEGKPYQGEDNFIAQSEKIPGAVIQLIGPADDLIFASSVTTLSSNKDANTVAFMIPLALANQFNKKAGEWVTESLKGDYSSKFEHNQTFEGVNYEVSYAKMESLGMLTLSIKAE